MDPDPDGDPDPAIFFIDLQDPQQKTSFKKVFLIITFCRYIYIIFQIWKGQKKSQNSRNPGFSYFSVMIDISSFAWW